MTVLILHTGLSLSPVFELSQYNVLFDSIKTIKTGCYNNTGN